MIFDQIRNLPDNPCNERKLIMKDCPDCDGDGYFNDSECCNAPIKWGDICTACGEHAGFSPCYNCEGTGKIPLTDDELQELKDAEAERIYENNKSENEIK